MLKIRYFYLPQLKAHVPSAKENQITISTENLTEKITNTNFISIFIAQIKPFAVW